MLDLVRSTARAFALAGVLAAAIGVSASAQNAGRVAVDADNVAIKGYDTVAYFIEGKPVKGSGEFEHVWNEARWWFASAANREAFAADPERYSPQFGGFCAWMMTEGVVAVADPEEWTIVNGRLYLKMDHVGTDKWRQDPGQSIALARQQWNQLGRVN